MLAGFTPPALWVSTSTGPHPVLPPVAFMEQHARDCYKGFCISMTLKIVNTFFMFVQRILFNMLSS